MIDAKELRIGNMVMFMGREIYAHGGTIQDLERDNAVQSQYKPIPLTTEVLSSIGFEKTVSYYMEIRKGLNLEIGLNKPPNE